MRLSVSREMKIACCVLGMCAGVVSGQPVAPTTSAVVDWSGYSTIDPHRADILDFLDTNLLLYDQLAAQAHQQGKFEDAARLYLFVLRHRNNDPRVLYNLACAYAHLGEGRLAAKALERAFECGFSNFDTFEQDKDFDSMRGDFFFAAARDRVLARKASIGGPFYVEARQLLAGRLHLPRTYRSGKAYPLVIGLHGRGAACEDFARIWSVLDNPQFIFLSLESPYAYPPGVESHKPAYTWGLPTRDKALWALADSLVSDNLKRAVETVSKQHRIDGVYILGHSQGASFAYLAAVRYPELFRGVLAFAGIFPGEQISADENARAKGKVRVFIAHGTRDQSVPLAEGLRCKEALVKLGYSVTFFQFDGDHGISVDALKRGVEWIEKGR